MGCQGYLISFQNYDRENHQINIPTMIALRYEQKDSHSLFTFLYFMRANARNFSFRIYLRCAEDSKGRCTVDGSANIAKIVFKQPQIMAKSFYK